MVGFLACLCHTQDKKYLSASEKFFDIFNFPKNLKIFKTIDPVIKGIDGLLSLGEVSEHSSVYKIQAHQALQEVLNRFWDNPENSKVNNDYGFIEITESGKSVIKKTISNGWIMKSFIRMADDKFDLVSSKK